MSVRQLVEKASQALRVWAVLAAVVLAATLVALLHTSEADAVSTLPSGFQESTVFSGLTNPTTVQFSKDGRVFVAEQSGLIKVFDNLSDTTPTTFADLRTKVHNYWDRGMLGMALDPNYPTNPYVYVLYTHDAPIGGTAPRWGTAGATSDGCPSPPGALTDGCVVSGHLSRLQADPTTNTMIGPEQVLIEDWCQQFPAHSVGGLVFGSDGALYVGGGDGANWTTTDYGQAGGSSGSPTPKNPCGDPPGGVGATLSAPTAEGGALRTQDLRTSTDPVGLNGSILRVDPATGNALPDNPLISNPDPNARRIIAHGLRNPFRFTMRPGTNEIWLGDVGWNDWEEIDRIANPTDTTVENFGWPCYEGNGRQAGYDGVNLNICENLYGQANAVSAPYFAYRHNTQVAGESCPTNNGSVISALAFYKGGPYPDEYDDALFFGDHSRRCIWVMPKGTNGLPNPGQLKPFVTNAENPVDLQIGPNGDLFYVDLNGGAIRRVQYTAANPNQPPVARATANPTSGALPLTVGFDGTTSSDAEGTTLSYEWDLDGDGAFDDSTAVKPTYTYTTAGDYQVGLRVTDGGGASDTLDQPLTISAGNTAPTATIDSPLSTTTWKVGDNISFSGSATDQQDGALGASKLTWSLIMHHCSSQNSCHEHRVQDFAGVSSGSFVAPDHEYPSYLELRLRATDSGGLSDTRSVRLDPKTVELTFGSDPSGLQLTVGSSSATTPFTRTVIAGSKNSVSAPSPQTLAGTTYDFASWSDGGTQSHDIVAPDAATTYTATYTPSTTAANGLKGEYYDNQDLTSLKLTRTDPKVDFGWGSGSPDSSIAPDTFSVRWSGQVKADHTEPYTFYSSTNDGVRLRVDGQQIINRWSDGALTNTGTISLQSGQWYPITMEYYEGINSASAKLEYSSSSTPRQVVPTDHLRPGASSDVTAPTVNSFSPTDGATGVAASANAEATFSEAMDPATITGSTFTLTKQGASQPVTAAVSYDGPTKKATLNPTADLDPSATYTATIKGGSGGVKDLAGNALGADKSWNFSSAAAPQAPQTANLSSVADAGLSELAPTTNSGAVTTLKVDGDDPDPGGGDLYAAIRWNLSQIPAAATVTSAGVTLNISNVSPQTYGAYELKKAWNEGQITWNQAATGTTWATPGAKDTTTDRGSQIASVTPASLGSYAFTIPASVVQGWINTPSSNNGILLANTTNFDGFVFDTKEGAQPPKLVVNYTTSGGADTTTPETTIDSGPSGTVNSASASFTFSSNETGSTFECSLDGGTFSGCTSPKSYTGLSEGSHTFQVRAKDAAGNTDATPASRTWTVDTSPQGDPVLVGAGDIASCSSSGDEATANLLDGISGTVFTTGDNAYESGTAAEFANCYDPSWGRHKARTMPTVGNHEYQTSGASGYYGYFGAAAGDPDKGYYSYDRGQWHIVALNSMCENVGGCGATSPMVEWLKADLAANPSSCTAAIFHHPLFNSGSTHGNNPKMRPSWDVLYAAGAEVVLNGHEHIYERFAPQTPGGVADSPQGIREFIAGMGGKGHYSFGTIQPNSQVRHSGTFGVLKLTLHPNSYDWQFVPEAGKTFTDSGSDQCHAAPGNADMTAPTVGTVAPTDGATGVAVTANAEATFSEAMDPATITGSTFTLTKQGATQPVGAQVSYDAANKKATLDPTSALEPSATYTATVKGGSGGVKDLAGNPLAADKTWSFATAATPPPLDITPPETTINSGPSGTTREKTATFAFSSSEAGSTFECKLDGGAFSACTSPKKYSGLAVGSHTFSVRAKDASGNTDASPATRTWTVRR